MKKLIIALSLLAATQASGAEPRTIYVETVIFSPSAIWNVAQYPEEEQCEKSKKAGAKAARAMKAKIECLPLLVWDASPTK